MGAEEQIAEALLPAVRAAGLEIWDVERSGASVRVLVERPGGVDLDSISQLSAAVSAILDQRDDIVPGGRYMLEVSSPGLERRLRQPSHFARYVGEEVAVRTVEAFNGTRRLRGTLTGATDEGITIRADGGPGGETLRAECPVAVHRTLPTRCSPGGSPRRGQIKPAQIKPVRQAVRPGGPANRRAR